MAIPVSTTKSDRIHYAEEQVQVDGALSFEQRTAEVVPQGWDVTNPELRDAIAKQQGVGEHAQWFIDPVRNAAALVVFRPREPLDSRQSIPPIKEAELEATPPDNPSQAPPAEETGTPNDLPQTEGDHVEGDKVEGDKVEQPAEDEGAGETKE